MSSTRRITIALVDPHEVLRIGLRTILQADPALHVVGEAGSLAYAIRLTQRLEPELVLTEMALPDVIQILANGRKSGVLTIQADGKSGEVFFLEGAICDARFGEHRGDDAFYRMMKVTEGDFVLDTTRAPTDRSMNASTETLLLEAMRRIDEGLV